MKKIWKFELNPNEEVHHIKLPQNSRVIAIGRQHDKIALWALFTTVTEEPLWVERVFRVAMTGQTFADNDLRTYIGTVQFETRHVMNTELGALLKEGYFVCHVFEETS